MNQKKQLLRRIHSYDFTILELGIYLDTHPDDMRALKARQQAQEKRALLVQEYEAQYGPYVLTSEDVKGTAGHGWIIPGPGTIGGRTELCGNIRKNCNIPSISKSQSPICENHHQSVRRA